VHRSALKQTLSADNLYILFNLELNCSAYRLCLLNTVGSVDRRVISRRPGNSAIFLGVGGVMLTMDEIIWPANELPRTSICIGPRWINGIAMPARPTNKVRRSFSA